MSRQATKTDEYEDPPLGEIGKQVIEDTDPLTQERLETVGDDLLAYLLNTALL